jgi:RimK family alpha-L-glutamate ligase
MRVCVLGSPDGWYFRDLQRAALGRCQLECVPFTGLHAGWNASSQQTIVSDQHRLSEFDAIIVRSMPPGSLEQVVFRMDVLGRLEAQGTTVLNPPRALEAAIDKYLSSARLRAAGLPVPATWVGQNCDDALQAFALLGEDVVIKPLFGSEGRGLVRVNDAALAWRTCKTLSQLGAVIYMQQFIPHAGYDIRVLVIGSRLLTIKRVNPNDWRTNLSQGGRAEPYDPPTEITDLARRAAEALGAPLAGVDILPGNDGSLYLLEVNAVPGWQGLSRALGIDVAAMVLDYARQ